MKIKFKRLLCKIFGHQRWYYTPNEHPNDLWFGCTRCMNPDTITDKVIWYEDPNYPGWGYVSAAAMERMKGRLDG